MINKIFFRCLNIKQISNVVVFQDPKVERSKALPRVIIIGAKKGGTRGLIEFLNIHPQVRAAGPEIHFFDRRFRRGFRWYISKMASVGPGELAMEKTPGK
jgi:hypothetical protein